MNEYNIKLNRNSQNTSSFDRGLALIVAFALDCLEILFALLNEPLKFEFVDQIEKHD